MGGAFGLTNVIHRTANIYGLIITEFRVLGDILDGSLDLVLEFGFAGEVELVLGGEDVGIFGEGEFDEGVFFAFAEDDADRRVFVGGFDEPIEVVDVHLHLAEVLVGEFVDFEVDQDVAAQESVVEDKIDVEVVFLEAEAFLAGLEEEAFAEFEQELFEFIDDGGFEFVFGVGGALFEFEKFQDVGVFDGVAGGGDDLGGEAFDFGWVAAEGETIVEGGVDLAFHFAD